MKTLFLSAVITLIVLRLNAQTSSDVLSNKNIIELHNAGLSDKLIISKIQASNSKFDVSTNGIIALKKANVSEDIIEAMVDKGLPATGNNIIKGDAKPINTNSAPVPDIENINQVYLYANQELKPLEKNTATMHSRTKALGYGGAEAVFEVEGDKSPIHFTKDSTKVFMVNTGGGPGDAFVLYKVDVKKGKRQAVSATFSTFSGMKGSKGIIPIDVKSVKASTFKLIPSAALDKGEYFFASKSAGSTLSSTTIDIYAFGID